MVDQERCEDAVGLGAMSSDSYGSQTLGELSGATGAAQINGRTRVLLMSVRQGLIMMLGALEDYLDLPRSIVPRRKRL